LPGSWSNGHTPVGWVPGGNSGSGKGSGNSPGVGDLEPPKHASEGPGTHPAPEPPPPPEPRKVSLKVCSESGMLPGENCKHTRTETYIEGHEPGHTCNKCEPEHKSRLADQEKPVLVRDSEISVPASVEEGLSVTVQVQYTVTADGDVSGIDVIRSSGNHSLDKAVVSATSRLKYKPAVSDGVARSVKMTRSYTVKT
jgi:TonB family protein